MSADPIVTPTSLKLRFKEFRGAADDELQMAIDDAVSHIDDTVFSVNDSFIKAWTYLSAHFYVAQKATEGSSGGGGARVKTESFGPISVTYDSAMNQVTPDPSDYTTTGYGQRYLQLLVKNQPAIFVV